MHRVIDKKFLKIGKEPIVVFPLKEWEKIEENIEELEEAVRFSKAFEESRNKKFISLDALKKKYKLK